MVKGNQSEEVVAARKALGDRVKQLRAERFTQGELAHAVGVKPPTISQIESGRKSPGRELLVRIAVALEVSVDVLLNGEEVLQESPADAVDRATAHSSLMGVVERAAPLPAADLREVAHVLRAWFALKAKNAGVKLRKED